MTQINPYITFNGNCREAMTFYKECLGGELSMQTIGESPMGDQTPVEMKDRIMHSTLIGDNFQIMASDMLGEDEAVSGNIITLCILCKSEEDIRKFFTSLSQGGTVGHELKEEFWGAIYGDLTDRFGVRWMLNFDKNNNE